MATVPDSLLLSISSPYARRGVLWQTYERHFGKETTEMLVWQATSRNMNPTLSQSLIDRALEEDESKARAEYLAEFRRDVEGFVDREAVEAVTIPGRRELPPVHNVIYSAFVDPAGGGGPDSMTMAVAHRLEGDEELQPIVLDVVREVRPPFSPTQVVKEFAQVLKQYSVNEISGDRYAGMWPREQFQNEGVEYLPLQEGEERALRGTASKDQLAAGRVPRTPEAPGAARGPRAADFTRREGLDRPRTIRSR